MTPSRWERTRRLGDAAARAVGQAVDQIRAGATASSSDSAADAPRPGTATAHAESELSAFALTADEVAVTELLKFLMIERDVAAAGSPSSRPVKLELRDRFAADVVDTLRSTTRQTWRDAVVEADAGAPEEQCAALLAAAREAAASLTRRSRALLVLVELYTFAPWPWGHPWSARVRQRSLDEVVGLLTALAPGDGVAVATEIDAALRQLRRKQVRWGRVAAVGVIGLGLGAATMGLAAPLIGASIGAAAGLSGAAATSAGLATIGGGSIAAGGLGVAGGTAVLTGAGAVAGAGAAAGGARATRWAAPADVALEALRAEVVTRLVVLGQEHDEEKAKRVVQALQARLDDVTAGIAALGRRIEELTATNETLSAENQRLKEELEAEQARAHVAGAALEIAIDRIPVSAEGSGDG